MSLNHFGLRIKHSYLRIYEELVWKEFSILVLRAPVDSRLLLAPEGTTLSFITK